MEPILRKLAVFVGVGLLLVSVFWSQDGFNFDLAGNAKYGNMAVFIGWFLALSVTVIQFVFSTSYKELNASLKFFGILAYIYSIYTNYWGILSFQGWVDGQPKMQIGAGLLAFVMDGVPEPLIAWGLYESLRGDFIGNLLRVLGSQPTQQNQSTNQAIPSNQVQQVSRNERHEGMRTTGGSPQQIYPNTSLPRVDQRPVQDVPKFLMEQQRKKNKSR